MFNRLLILLMLTGVAGAQTTARDYYNELVEAEGLDGYADEYVCFTEPPSDHFFIFATSDLLRRTAGYQADVYAGQGDKTGEKTFRAMANLPGEFITFRSYKKGISTGQLLFMDKLPDSESYSADVAAGGHSFKETLWVNLKTGRYTFAVTNAKQTVNQQQYGRCEHTKVKGAK